MLPQTRSMWITWVVCICVATEIGCAGEPLLSEVSGIKGITMSIVISGIPGGPTQGGPASLEFAIAPIVDSLPNYDHAQFVKSDERGSYEVRVPPGQYWLGPKAKAIDPKNYRPTAFTFSERVVTVRAGNVTEVDLVQEGHAP